MASYRLLVPNIKPDVFSAYWYGNGRIITAVEGEVPGTVTYVIDYEDDEYRCRYQDGRFASGMYFSKVEEF